MKRGVWIIGGTPVGEPYPCRCHQRKYDRCAAMWCVCAGRPDPQNDQCCANWFGPAEVPRAQEEHDRKKRLNG